MRRCMGPHCSLQLTTRPEVDTERLPKGSSYMDQPHGHLPSHPSLHPISPSLPLSTVSRATSSYHCPPENSSKVPDYLQAKSSTLGMTSKASGIEPHLPSCTFFSLRSTSRASSPITHRLSIAGSTLASPFMRTHCSSA